MVLEPLHEARFDLIRRSLGIFTDEALALHRLAELEKVKSGSEPLSRSGRLVRHDAKLTAISRRARRLPGTVQDR
jgi:hypothetical protein